MEIDFKPKFFEALRNYSKEKFAADLMAGIIVGIVALPLAIAFGIASGVSPEKGLITAVIGGFIVSLLGGSSVQIGGPTGAFIVTVYGIIQQFGLEGLAVATAMAGVMLVLMGLLRLGVVIRFIPYPIVIGFTSGIALTIFTTQVGDFLGLGLRDVPADFLSKWAVYFQHLFGASVDGSCGGSDHCGDRVDASSVQESSRIVGSDRRDDRRGYLPRLTQGFRASRPSAIVFPFPRPYRLRKDFR